MESAIGDYLSEMAFVLRENSFSLDIEKLMEQVKDYDCVIGFQLDNETKPYDTCSKYAQAKFVEYLKNEFPDIDEFKMCIRDRIKTVWGKGYKFEE